jgi:hypothetical protein
LAAPAAREGPLRVLAVLNLADPGDNRDTVETAEALAGFPQFTLATAIVRRRKALARRPPAEGSVFRWLPQLFFQV